MASRLPVVVVLGATGAGKSKLALELAQRYPAEIISADAMQLYKGLDIITNKVTKEEQELVPHHMLDFLSPLTENYTVVDFRNQAVPIIDQLLQKRKMPVIVGGTNYYIESLLWNFLLDKPSTDKSSSYEVFRSKVRQQPTETLYERLMTVDKKSSEKIHPKDRRKICRALDVYEEKRKKLSELHDEQHEQDGTSGLSGALRYPNTCILWVQCDQTVLDNRTNKRVDQMIEAGLVHELEDFWEKYKQHQDQHSEEEEQGREYTVGIFQSIGFKEFHDYLSLPVDLRGSSEGVALKAKGIEKMKIATRQYARRQRKWIVSRFLKKRGDNVPNVYAVDSTNPSDWQTKVYQPAVGIVDNFLMGESPEQEPLKDSGRANKQVYNKCQICDMVFVTAFEWEAHIKGRKHKKRQQSNRLQEHKKIMTATEVKHEDNLADHVTSPNNS